MLGLKVGETFTLEDADGSTAAASGSPGICENYVSNFIFMDAAQPTAPRWARRSG